MKFIQCGPTGSDATAPYDVILDSPYTVKDLVCEILAKHEWGEIRFPGYTFKYRGSSCDAMPPDLLQLQIREVKASGGYGNMNYYIKTSVKATVLPIIAPSTLSNEQKEKRTALNHITTINGVEIFAEVTSDGNIFVPIKPICSALGIDYKRQRDKIYEDDILSSVGGLRSDGKQYEMYCLPLEYIFVWLSTVNLKNVAESAREIVKNYRRECDEALYNYFSRSLNRQIKENEAELELLQKINSAIADEKDARIRRKKAEEALDKLRSERLNPQQP